MFQFVYEFQLWITKLYKLSKGGKLNDIFRNFELVEIY